jgi:hypothetical protein
MFSFVGCLVIGALLAIWRYRNKTKSAYEKASTAILGNKPDRQAVLLVSRLRGERLGYGTLAAIYGAVLGGMAWGAATFLIWLFNRVS